VNVVPSTGAMSSSSSSRFNANFNSGRIDALCRVVSPFIQLMTSSDFCIAEEAARVVFNIASISVELREVILQSRGLDVLVMLYGKQEALPISFMRVVTETHVMLSYHTGFRVTCQDGTMAKIPSLMDEKPIPALVAVLMHQHYEYLSEALYMIHRLMSTADANDLEALKEELKAAGVLGHLENLQQNENNEVRNLAMQILSKYFADDGEDAKENVKETEEKTTKKVHKRKREEETEDGNSVVATALYVKKAKKSSHE
ncbi:hypothetical protein PMAYCL1PPCAC_26457, partial [Pristionchus mayeri]